MQYEKFKNILNEKIFEESKAVLIEKIAKNPNRYIGLFRPTKPKAKILQNLLQSHEILFGDAFEIIIEEYLQEFGYEILEKKLINSDDDKLNLDQCFKVKDKVYFIEQKVRDDHDSTKKRGQISNFEKKLSEMANKYNESSLLGIFYFIDPDLHKNRNYYQTELKKMMHDYGVELHLFYGKELFDFLQHENTWGEILKYLEKWKIEIPDFPETNFDIDAESSFEEIKDLAPRYYRKIFQDNAVFDEIILTIFPEKKTLRLLLDYFRSKASERTIYQTIADLLQAKL